MESDTSKKVYFHQPSNLSFITIKGAEALDLLDRLTTNDLSSIKPMEHIYTILTSPKGRMIDMLSVLRLDDYIVLGCSKNALNSVLEWIDFYTFGEDIEIILDQKDYESSLVIFGDNSIELFNKTFDLDMSLLEGKSMYVAFNSFSAGRTKILIVNKKFYHKNHYEIYSTHDNIQELVSYFAKTQNFDSILMNDNNFNDYRIINNIPAYPSEINEEYNPLEAGLKKYISFNKGCYVGQEVITRLESYEKVQNKLVLIKALKPLGPDITFEDTIIGKITSHSSDTYHSGAYKLAYMKKKFLNDKNENFVIHNLDDINN